MTNLETINPYESRLMDTFEDDQYMPARIDGKEIGHLFFDKKTCDFIVLGLNMGYNDGRADALQEVADCLENIRRNKK